MTIAEQITMIAKGIDPLTGECFDPVELSDPVTANAVIRLSHMALPQYTKRLPKLLPVNTLNRPVNRIFEQLKEWRLNEALSIQLPAYCVFSDRQLYNIAESDVECKEDLLLVNGISQEKYDYYADAVFDILKEYINPQS